MSDLFVDNIKHQSSQGSGTITIGASGEAVDLGATAGGTFTARPAFHARMTAAQTIAHNTAVKIQFDDEVFDTDNAYDPSTNYRFTPQVAGKYMVSLNYFVNGGGTGNLRVFTIRIMKNGNIIHVAGDDKATGYQNNGTETVTGIVDMNGSTDYLEAYVYHFTQDSSSSSSGGADDYSANFSAYKLIGV